ncbi:DUF5947 family protein [Conexibacter sp. DBS9H8]|uniref:DUF5947 family protein n=1 Tax=Conexibacter sp. DBS9H8 TaxID=2937801 RepID=UPI00200C68BA|nr:DUF5947 family protein [Conexibacter sp. DBS9H8]
MSPQGLTPGYVQARRAGAPVTAHQRARTVSGLRALMQGEAPGVRPDARSGRPGHALAGPAPLSACCELCGGRIEDQHRHLIALVPRQIICTCEACWGMRSGEGDYRPVGSRTLWLGELQLPDDLWARFQIPIGLAFFMHSTVTACVVAMYPSPVGATESELHFSAWNEMTERNPLLASLEPDIEALIVNRLSEPAQSVIAPIDRCYELTGTIKAHWEGISGGAGVAEAVAAFFTRLRREARTWP